MYSRSRILIERDYRHLLNIKPWGIEAYPLVDDNYYEWTAVIHGLRNTDWEGGVFRLYIKFTEAYNDEPPKVCFHSIPFHPNIDAVTGQPSIDVLNNPKKWNPSFDTLHILIAIQTLLSYPKLDDAFVVNSDAANMCLYYPSNYLQTVHQCVATSQTIQVAEVNAELDFVNTRQHLYSDSTSRLAPPDVSSDVPERMRTSVTASAARRQCRIPFEDYYSMWSNIATSTTGGKFDTNPSNKLVNGSSAEQTKSRGTSSASKQDAATKRKIEHVRRMREVYMQRPPTTPQQPDSSRSQTAELWQGTSTTNQSRQFEREVDELVSWTTRLDV